MDRDESSRAGVRWVLEGLMASNVVNLRIVRKRKARAETSNQASKNRARFGRGKAEKALQAHERDQADRSHDGHRIDDETDQ
jgi:hypothetical protein